MLCTCFYVVCVCVCLEVAGHGGGFPLLCGEVLIVPPRLCMGGGKKARERCVCDKKITQIDKKKRKRPLYDDICFSSLILQYYVD